MQKIRFNNNNKILEILDYSISKVFLQNINSQLKIKKSLNKMF